jgi:hypothetical protein
MKHVTVPFSYSVHISTPIRGRNGRRGVSPVSSPVLASCRPSHHMLFFHVAPSAIVPSHQIGDGEGHEGNCTRKSDKLDILLTGTHRWSVTA